MIEILKNDKLWVIAFAGIITIFSIILLPEKADTIVLAYISGSMGLAVGQRIRQGDIKQ